MTFAELLAVTKKCVLEGSEHQNFFFGRLIEKLGLRPNPSRSPIFSVSFNYESGHLRQHAGGLQIELALDGVPFGSPADTTKFDLCVNAAEKEGELLINWDYDADLFDQTTIRRWLGHFKTLLEGIAANPQQSVWTLPLLTETERRQILIDWNATGRPLPEATLPELFEAQVERAPASHGPGVWRGVADLSRAQRAGQPAGASFDRAGRGARKPGGHCAGALHRDGGGLAGHSQGRRGLPALGSGLSPSPAGHMLADAAPALVLTTGVLRARLSETIKMLTLDAIETASLR